VGKVKGDGGKERRCTVGIFSYFRLWTNEDVHSSKDLKRQRQMGTWNESNVYKK